MKFFDGIQRFFTSIGEYVKNFSNLFLIFLGAFALISVVVIIITSFSYECKLTKTIDKINKFLERNPRINDDNLVAFNNMMKANSVPKTLRRQWQQFMLYREHPASYYMSFKHCVENPLRNSTYNQQMTIYRIVSYVLVVLSLVVSAFMATQSYYSSFVLQDILVIPTIILVCYWLISMVLNLVHSAISGDLFQNYQYFEINMDKAMLTLPEFVDYEVLFTQEEIRRGIPVLFAYLQKRAIQEQQELEKARLKSVDHEKFDFDKAGLDGSLVLDRAMRETENFSAQRKKYMQEIERVNNEIAVLENNYREQTKEFQRQVQTSKETVENLKEQLEQATSTIEINYIKKQMRDEINRQQLAEKDFDILTDKHNQEIKSLNQEIKHYDEEIKHAKEALEVAMLSEFNTYSVKVYDNLEKIVDDKMQDKVDDYKEQIKGLEGELEEKNEELENVYTRYQEVLAQVPEETDLNEEVIEEEPVKNGKKKKKSSSETPVDDGMIQPDVDSISYDDYSQYDNNQEYSDYDTNNMEGTAEYEAYDQANNFEQYDNNQEYYDDQSYVPTEQYDSLQENSYDEPAEEYVPLTDEEFSGLANEEYVPAESEEYVPLFEDEYSPQEEQKGESTEEYVPLSDEQPSQDQDFEYVPLNEYQNQDEEYIPLNEYSTQYEEYQTQEEPATDNSSDIFNASSDTGFDDSDFDIDFSKPASKTDNFDDMDFEFNLGDEEPDEEEKPAPKFEEIEDGELDLNKMLGIYDDISVEDEIKVQEEPADVKTTEESQPVQEEQESEQVEVEEIVPQPKRKAGRPRKVVDEDAEIKPKRRVGRPRKIVESTEIKPKRKAGRPKKNVEQVETTEVVEKRKVGRPRKVEVATEVKTSRKAGRPKKAVDESVQILDKPKRKAGRPKKEVEQVQTTEKRKAGRPRKDAQVKTDVVVKHRGRPRKDAKLTVVAQAKRRGRPRKEVKPVEETTKRRVGRPKKVTESVKINIETKRRGRPRKSN